MKGGAWKQSGVADHVGYLGGGGGALVGRARRARLCLYGLALAFGAFAAFLAFAPSLPAPPPSSPAAAWFDGLLASASPYRAQVSGYFSSLFPANSTSPEPPGGAATNRRGSSGGGGFSATGGQAGTNGSSTVVAGEQGRGVEVSSSNAGGVPSGNSPSGNATAAMQSNPPPNDQAGGGAAANNSTTGSASEAAVPSRSSARNGTMTKDGAPDRINGTDVIASSSGDVTAVKANARNAAGSTHQLGGASAIVDSSNGTAAPSINKTGNAAVATDGNGAAPQRGGAPGKNQTVPNPPAALDQNKSGNRAAASGGSNSTMDATPQGIASNTTEAAVDAGGKKKKTHWIEAMASCDMFYGNWVRDDSYPLYPEGSCPHIDESFNCPLNGRPDNAYQRLRWQPSGCSIPR